MPSTCRHDDIRAADKACCYGFRPSREKGWTLPAGVQPIAADERNGLACSSMSSTA